MEKDIKQIIESWTGIEETIHDFLKREEKMSIALSDTGLLSGHQFDALAVIAFFDIHNVTKIAQTIGCSKSAASIMLTKMMSKELVTKSYGHNAQDNRSIYIDITEKGAAVIESFMETRLNVVADIYDKMSDYLKTEILEGLKCFLAMSKKHSGFLIEATEKLIKKHSYPQEKNEYIITLARFVASRISGDKLVAENPYSISKNLTLQQIGMLKAINTDEQNTVSKLVKHFGTSVSTVSVNVSRLAKSGYIVKEYGKTDDNRETILSITPKAKDELKSVEEKCFEMFTKQYEKMDEQEKRLLEKGLEHFDNAVKSIRAEVKL